MAASTLIPGRDKGQVRSLAAASLGLSEKAGLPWSPGTSPGRVSVCLQLLTFLRPPGIRGDQLRLSLLLEATENSLLSIRAENAYHGVWPSELHAPFWDLQGQRSLESKDRSVYPKGQCVPTHNGNNYGF